MNLKDHPQIANLAVEDYMSRLYYLMSSQQSIDELIGHLRICTDINNNVVTVMQQDSVSVDTPHLLLYSSGAKLSHSAFNIYYPRELVPKVLFSSKDFVFAMLKGAFIVYSATDARSIMFSKDLIRKLYNPSKVTTPCEGDIVQIPGNVGNDELCVIIDSALASYLEPIFRIHSLKNYSDEYENETHLIPGKSTFFYPGFNYKHLQDPKPQRLFGYNIRYRENGTIRKLGCMNLPEAAWRGLAHIANKQDSVTYESVYVPCAEDLVSKADTTTK